MSDDEGQDELVTEEMLWDRIPQVHGEERANTYYELSARIFARGQYDDWNAVHGLIALHRFQNRESVDFRHHQVKHDQVRTGLADFFQRLAPIARAKHPVGG